MNKNILGIFTFKNSAGCAFTMIACALIIHFIDSQLPQGVSVGEAYAILALIGLMGKDSRLIVVGATVGTVLTLEGLYISEHGSALWIVWTNRLLAIFIIWVVAVFSLEQVQRIKEQEELEKVKETFDLLKKESTYSTLLKEIAIIANSSDAVEEVLKQAMHKISLFKGWSIAHVYVKKGEEELLRSSKLWFLEDWEGYKEFKEKTETIDFHPGVGLPGRVLAQQKCLTIQDLKKDSNFPRIEFAQENGLQSGFAFPVFIGPKIIAVMEFYSKDPIVDEPKWTEFAETIGLLLGRPFERDHSGLRKGEYEKHLMRLYSRMKADREKD